MEKKLPKVFANQPNKQFNNNDKVFSSADTRQTDIEQFNAHKGDKVNKSLETTKLVNTEKNIYQKIGDIFNSEKYVYKAPVEIKTSKGLKTTNIIGQNRTHLITIDNELIPITDIEDIYYIN